jgi:Cof subfamily protein (haloacid dehalogenase superfamily)
MLPERRVGHLLKSLYGFITSITQVFVNRHSVFLTQFARNVSGRLGILRYNLSGDALLLPVVPMNIRLLAVDLDGTLLDSKWQLSPTNIEALSRAHSREVAIAFVTGRRYTFTRPLIEALGFPYYAITNAGASTRSSLGKPLFRHPLVPGVSREFLRFTRAIRPWTFLIFDVSGPREVLCESPHVSNPHVARYLGLNEKFLSHVDNLERFPEEPLLQIVLMGHIEEMRHAAALIETFPGRDGLTVLRTEYPNRDFALLDVIGKDVNKGRAVEELSASIGVMREEVMAIGDNHNDLDMLTYAGYPVVMENAPDELKRPGWEVTATNDANGVASAIERFILNTRDWRL